MNANRFFRLALMTTLLVVLAASSLLARTWSDKSGKFSVEAELIEVVDGKARLRRADGKIVSVPLTTLSDADRRFIDRTRSASGSSRSTGESNRAADDAKQPVRRLALLIGVNDYTDVRDLDYAVADTTSLEERLIAAGFLPENIIRMASNATSNDLRPTRRMVERQFDPEHNGSFLSRIRKGDLALVAMAGHGVERNGSPYFCPIDAELGNPGGSMVSIDLIYNRLSRSPARFKLVIIDACRDDPQSGAGRSAAKKRETFRGFSKSLDASSDAAGKGIMVMASCAAGQQSFEDSKIGHGVFMYHLMKGLTGDADRLRKGNDDGTISMLELYGFAAEETRIYASRMDNGGVQTPVLKGEFTDFDFTHGQFAHLMAKLTVRLSERTGPAIANAAVAVVRRDAFGGGEERLAEGRTNARGQVELRIPRDKLSATDDLAALVSHYNHVTRLPLPRLTETPQRDLIAQLPTDFTNSVGMQFRLIPAGEFKMGSSLSAEEVHEKYPGGKAEYYEDEHPRHKVRITRPFYMGVHEVTVGDFKRFVSQTSYRTTAEREGTAWGYSKAGEFEDVKGLSWRNPGFAQTDRHPVTCVSWDDTKAFCEWLNKSEGKRYRLPREAEWEYACRAGTSTAFFWGNDADDGEGYLNGAGLEGFPIEGKKWTHPFDFDDGFQTTSPVGHYKPNAWGLYDMHGNVYEWCSDLHASDYYANSPTADPTGPSSGASDRVDRGGGWYSSPRSCRAAYREWNSPDGRIINLGFRLALVPSD